jgi:8-oxo-dGTP pyrophosphatase MutT (NUDIX family)
MPIPDFLRELRGTLGHQLLFLPAVTALVFDDEERLLLNRRADNGRWSLVGGICEPGEQPATTAVREVMEETAVQVVVERLVLVQTNPPVEYPNGDVTQYLDLTFRCRAVGGEARVADDESLDVGWFALDSLPDLGSRAWLRIKQARADEPVWFEPAEPPQATG